MEKSKQVSHSFPMMVGSVADEDGIGHCPQNSTVEFWVNKKVSLGHSVCKKQHKDFLYVD